MKGYHYTTLGKYEKIKVEGLIPAPITNPEVLEVSKDTEGIWLCRNPQEDESLFGLLVERFVFSQDWKMVELKVDFKIKDCIRAIDDEEEIVLKHTGYSKDWVYHKKIPVFVVRKEIPPCQIQLRRQFNLFPRKIN